MLGNHGAAAMRQGFGKAWPALGALFGAAALAAGPGPDWLNAETRFLPVDEAFALSTETDPEGALLARWQLAPGYYLYRHRFAFQVRDGQAAALGEPEIAPGEPKTDAYFGAVEVHYQHVQARVPVQAADGPVEIGIGYQGCADAGLCYPPQTRWVLVDGGGLANALAGAAQQGAAMQGAARQGAAQKGTAKEGRGMGAPAAPR